MKILYVIEAFKLGDKFDGTPREAYRLMAGCKTEIRYSCGGIDTIPEDCRIDEFSDEDRNRLNDSSIMIKQLLEDAVKQGINLVGIMYLDQLHMKENSDEKERRDTAADDITDERTKR